MGRELMGLNECKPEQLKNALKLIIEKQLKDASMRRDDPSYWGGTSKMVTAAAWSAKNAIERAREQAKRERILQPVIEEVEKAYRQFSEFFSDDDGPALLQTFLETFGN